eukprot:CAMPEP_0206139324 /NCGR_PEP_ID=MMETSP1473-20131121/5533_1 /ASSEMBLY_ACC=CAM_ASM_001109 /TAXON_ID=1461547 /ORGANISM="Stichococcus sp, Strain RCC1054" /LENGTH=30 /DNA_ID= /DNA_START= /DNA_END= /DNA_ORIENTATION=
MKDAADGSATLQDSLFASQQIHEQLSGSES